MATVSTSNATANTPTRTLSPLIFVLLIVFSPSCTTTPKKRSLGAEFLIMLRSTIQHPLLKIRSMPASLFNNTLFVIDVPELAKTVTIPYD